MDGVQAQGIESISLTSPRPHTPLHKLLLICVFPPFHIMSLFSTCDISSWFLEAAVLISSLHAALQALCPLGIFISLIN